MILAKDVVAGRYKTDYGSSKFLVIGIRENTMGVVNCFDRIGEFQYGYDEVIHITLIKPATKVIRRL